MTNEQHKDILKNQAYLESIAINLASRANMDKNGIPLTMTEINELLKTIDKRAETLSNERGL